MHDSGRQHATPSDYDADGVRIIRTAAPGTRRARLLQWGALGLIAAGIGVAAYYTTWTSTDNAGPVRTAERSASRAVLLNISLDQKNEPVAADGPAAAATARPAAPAVSSSPPADWLSGEANDIATYYSPMDPEPSMAELIEALRASGETGGIAAFNPPGTSPPLQGLAVPENFPLPEGYVRHHQVTDGGEPLEPILMFSPDFDFFDAAGQPITIPSDRVVPPELAPPGLPIRPIEIPPPS